MYEIKVTNVNQALIQGVNLIKHSSINLSPRGIETLEYLEPVATTYTIPTQRVMLVPERDANPFFHLMESLWILAGRDDVEWLAKFNARMRDYSDDGVTFNAPYGYRLRKMFGFDQIRAAIDLLKKDPDTRRCVMQIWEPKDIGKDSKDIPCNDMIFLKIRGMRLNMTVCNRSNDIIWGAYGANAVQFSMIQEYIADKVGVGVGTYTQVSDSYHVYPSNPQWDDLKELPYSDFDPYRYAEVVAAPLMAQESDWDKDLEKFMSETDFTDLIYGAPFRTYWFNTVAAPMFNVWMRHKYFKDGMLKVEDIAASDWRTAATLWLIKREKKNGAE